MTAARSCDIVVAGHLCLDITPKFHDSASPGRAGISDILVPGKLVDVGACVVSTGGPVSNTGIALRRLGVDAVLMGKVGDDSFGYLIREVLKGYGAEGGAVVAPGEETSYSIVIAPPGIDRVFIHNPGANDTFVADDVNYEVLEGAGIFHFGYPPLMEKMFSDGGAELTDIVKVSVFLTDMSTFKEMNDAYAEFFGPEPPARITVGGIKLALGAAVEIECIARVVR